MERVESRLRESTVRPEELEELLERPRPDEVRALFRQGTGRALELFRLRGKAPRRRRPHAGATRPPDRRSTRLRPSGWTKMTIAASRSVG